MTLSVWATTDYVAKWWLSIPIFFLQLFADVLWKEGFPFFLICLSQSGLTDSYFNQGLQSYVFFIFVLQLPHFGEGHHSRWLLVFCFLWGFFCILSFFGISLSSEQDVSVHPAPWKMVFRNQDLGREASLIVFFKSSIAPYNICFS